MNIHFLPWNDSFFAGPPQEGAPRFPPLQPILKKSPPPFLLAPRFEDSHTLHPSGIKSPIPLHSREMGPLLPVSTAALFLPCIGQGIQLFKK